MVERVAGVLALASWALFSGASTAAPISFANNVCPTGADWVEGFDGDFSNDLNSPTVIVTTQDSFTICGMMGLDFEGDPEDYLTIPYYYGKLFDVSGAGEIQLADGTYDPLTIVSSQDVLWPAEEVFQLSFDPTGTEFRNFYYTYSFSLSDVAPVPLPAGALLLSGGLVLLFSARWRRRPS